MQRELLIGLLVFGLVAGACSGDATVAGADGVVATDGSSSPATTVTDETTGLVDPAASPADADATADPDRSAEPTDGSASPSTASPSTASPSTAPSEAASPAPSSGSESGGVPSPVPAGDYFYDTDGFTQLGLAEPESMPTTTTLEVTSPDARDQQFLIRDLRDADGNGTLSRTRVQFGVEGVVLLNLISTSTVEVFGAQQSQSSNLVAKPPTVIAPVDAAPGFRADLHLEGDGVVADGTIQITDTASMTIGGEEVDLFVVKLDFTFTGEVEGEQQATWWIRQGDLLVVREESVLDAVTGGVDYHEEHESQMRSLRPA